MIDIARIESLESNIKNTLMKKLWITTALLIAGFCCSATEVKNPLMASDTVVWAGLDYSMVRMFGENNSAYGFDVPDLIFPRMLEKWNDLFLDERIELVANSLRKRMSIDIGGVTERNKTATADQIFLTPGIKDVIEESHITQQNIAAEVQSYKMIKTNGLGLVFIVDRLIIRKRVPVAGGGGLGASRVAITEQENSEAVYVVFFEIATRNVISATREIHYASGGLNFRNHWFGPIKDTDENLGKNRESDKEALDRNGA